MPETSSDELRATRTQGLGPELGAVFHALWNEVVQLRWEWKEYRSLYVNESVDLLNDQAPEFFWLIQHVLSDHVIGSIANLTDKEVTARQPNLTVRRLPGLARAIDAALASQIEALLSEGDMAGWTAVREWRHKKLAHLDLDVVLERRAAPLQSVRVADIEASLAALTNVIDCVQRWCTPESHTVYDVLGRGGDASAVRQVLESARRHEEQRMERIRSGRATKEDFE
jgi:hypothetical protein